MRVSIRKFAERDIADKVRWINDPENNRFLHYDLPLEEEKTRRWFAANCGRTDRYDAVIELDGAPVGIIGLLSIDRRNAKAEYYVTIGERRARGTGAAYEATRLLLETAFGEMGLNRVYLYTESENTRAQRFFEKCGFEREGLIRGDLFSRGRYVDRYIYGITRHGFGIDGRKCCTPIQRTGGLCGNRLYMKREDLIGYSFGGNKARKARLFFEQIDEGGYDAVVTYGSGSSNHCRVTANMAAGRGIRCCIISPEENSGDSFNTELVRRFGAEITVCPVEKVHDTIEETLDRLRSEGARPFFIPGGGHGNTGTQAYVDCYEEICDYEAAAGVHFDYIFLASGTGTTQAGLVCGRLLRGDSRKIVGISIARRNPRGGSVVSESVAEYMREKGMAEDIPDDAVVFCDEYVLGGYGDYDEEVSDAIRRVLTGHGIALNPIYTGKAFLGMEKYIRANGITGADILFINTGGEPLFFDWLRRNNS